MLQNWGSADPQISFNFFSYLNDRVHHNHHFYNVSGVNDLDEVSRET